MGKQVSAKDRAFEKERGRFRKTLREKEQEIREKEKEISRLSAEKESLEETIRQITGKSLSPSPGFPEISRLSAEKESLEETIRQQAEWIERLLEYTELSKEELQELLSASRITIRTNQTLEAFYRCMFRM